MPRSLKLKESAPTIVALAIVAFASFFVVLNKGIQLVDFGDGQDYIRSAASILSGHGYLREDLTWPFFRPPGYPFAIAIIWKILGVNSIVVLKLFNICLHLLSTFIISRILRRHYDQKTSVVGIILFGLNPFVLIPLSDIQTEPLILFLFLAFCYFLTKKFSYLNVTFTCLLALSMTAVRPEYLFAILIICLILVASKQRSRASALSSLCILVTLALSLTWWGIQNKKATDSFIFLTNATDYLLWNGSTEQIYKNYAITLKYDSHFDSNQYIAIHNEIKSKIDNWGNAYTGATIGKKSSFWRNEYFKNVKESPMRYIGKSLEKMFIFWRPFLNPSSHGIKTSALSMLILVPISIGTAVRLIILRRKVLKDILILSYLSGLGVLTAIHMLQMPDQRYKFPLLIPLSSLVLAPLVWQILITALSKIGVSTRSKMKRQN